jgi:mono/diheme cytochrome c family protein
VRPGHPLGVLGACLALAACGSATSPTTTATTGTGATTAGRTRLQLPATARASGKAIFVHDCQACHSLIGNESERKQGGDLLGPRLSRAQLLSFTRVMPTRPLSARELAAVVAYVLAAEQRARR